MRTYNEVVGFDYTSGEEWQDFVRKQMLPLHKSISKVIKLRERIEQLLGYNLSDLIKNNTSIRKILLGGINEKGEYRPNSLAKIYKEIFGISINPKEWVALGKQPGIDASEYIKCDISDTRFLQFIETIKECVDRLLSLVEVSNPEVDEDEIQEILENPEGIMDELKAIYTHLINISANHSCHTFFILNIRCIPRYYIEQAYPKLKDKFEGLTEFLGLEPKFVPDVKEEEIKRDYTLWGHKENGFASLLYRLNRLIWEHFETPMRGWRENPYSFRNGLQALFQDIPNLKENYIKKVERILGNWKLENLKLCDEKPVNLHEWDVKYYLEISGSLIIRYFNTYSNSYYKKVDRRVELPLFEVINKMSPALFVRLVNLEVEDKHLVYDGNYLGMS